MKFLAFLLICIGLCCASDDKLCHGDHLKGVLKKCLKAAGSDEAAIQNLRHLRKASTVPEKCFRACVLLDCKFMDPAGKIDQNIHKSYIKLMAVDPKKQTLTKSIYEKCGKETKYAGNICSTGDNYFNCLNECKDCGWDWTKN